jgi:hypothetical protein
MSKIVIGVHGLGNKPPQGLLRKWWINAICEGFRKIDQKPSFFKFELLYWAHFIHPTPLNPDIIDHNDPLYIEEPYVASSANRTMEDKSNKKRILSLLEKQMDKLLLNEDLSINFSGISDLIIHHFFRDLEIYFTTNVTDSKNVSTDIKNKLKQMLHKYKNDEIMLLTHSMGTIVAYEALQELKNSVNIDTLVTIGSPLGIPVIMSKMFKRLNSSNLMLKKLTVPECVSNRWINISDLDDKVAVNYDLADDYPANSKGVAVEDFQVRNDYEYQHKANPHKLYGYLRTPEIARILIEFAQRDKSRLRLWIEHSLNPVFKIGK